MRNYVTHIFLLLGLTLSNCKEHAINVGKEKIKFYYLSCYQSLRSKDTMKYEEINHIDHIDELLATEHFKYKNQYHTINFYSSDNKAPVDGGALKYTLDSIGVIYGRAVWWPNFSRLSSNNDSINDLISAALGYIIMSQPLRCYYCRDEFTHVPVEVRN